MPMERLTVNIGDVKIMYNVLTKKFEATLHIHDTDSNTTEIVYLEEV